MNGGIQKASLWKRISAFLFDGILLGIVAVFFAWLLSVALQYDAYDAALNERYSAYEASFGVSFRLSLAEYEQLTPEQLGALDAAYGALAADPEAVRAYDMVVQLTFLITTLGILFAFLLVEFTVPRLLQNGQTLGKKIFGIALMRPEAVRVGNAALFIRAILGKYTLETMIPVYLLIMMYFNRIGLLGTVFLIVLLIVQIVLMLATRGRTPIHDLIAGTVAVDLQSQRIFGSREEMLAFKQKLHAEAVAGQAS